MEFSPEEKITILPHAPPPPLTDGEMTDPFSLLSEESERVGLSVLEHFGETKK